MIFPHIVWCIAGYGFVDFDSPSVAEVAVKALQQQGVQAQMAKVCTDTVSLLTHGGVPSIQF